MRFRLRRFRNKILTKYGTLILVSVISLKFLLMLCYTNHLINLGKDYIREELTVRYADMRYWPVRTFHSYVDNSSRCLIPKLDPFNPWAMRLLELEPKENEKKICERRFPLFFSPEMDDQGENFIEPVISRKKFEKIGIGFCCFQELARETEGLEKNKLDDGYRFVNHCEQLSLDYPTKVPANVEFVAIFCELDTLPLKNHPYLELRPLYDPFLLDILYFVTLKPEVEGKLRKTSHPPSEERLSVLALGLDSVSRSNFIRAMPKSHEFLSEKMGAVNLEGYHRVGSNTFSNLAPLYTGQTPDELDASCGADKYYDSCPLIWKPFEWKGYRTAFFEDWSYQATFHSVDTVGGHGFRRQPTHYYNRAPMILAKQLDGRICNGPRLSSNLLLDYMKRFVERMNLENKSFFHLSYARGVTHEKMRNAKLLDEPLRNALRWMKNRGYLNNTVLVIFSDQGLAESNDDNYLGRYESRLPYISIVLPEWFKLKYPKAFQNLHMNSQRLTTTFDLRQTIFDMLKPGSLKDGSIIKREWELKVLEKKGNLPRGISQFIQIPKGRTCEDASIQISHCICDHLWHNASEESEEVREAAEYAVEMLNGRVELLLNNAHLYCSPLNLSQILSAKESLNGKTKVFLIELETVPGHGQFMVQVALVSNQPREWQLLDEFRRLNPFKGEGRCVRGLPVEALCYCKK